MAPARCGRCALFLVAALALDAAGLALVLAGAVGRPTLGGRSFEDFLVLSGALLLFFSLLCWLFWYSGNLRGVPAQELPVGARPPGPLAPRPPRASLLRLAAKLSERLSQSQRRRLAPAPPAAPPAASGAPRSASPPPPPPPPGRLELSPLRPTTARPERGTPDERLV